MQKRNSKSAFSIIELSIVVLIIAVLAGAILVASRISDNAKLAAAQSLTKSSPVNDINGLVAWYETTMPNSFARYGDNVTALQADNGNAIATWFDLSPNKYDAVQATAANKPIYTTNVINGLPALSFNGTSDYMQAVITTIVSGGQVEAFVVCQRIAFVTNTSSVTFYQNGGSVNDYDNAASFVLAYEGSGTQLQTDRNGALSAHSPNPGNNAPYIFSTKFDGINNTSYFNGSVQTPVASSGNFGFNTALIGARYQASAIVNNYNGYIAEIILFNRALSDQEANDVTQYLGKKWGITVL